MPSPPALRQKRHRSRRALGLTALRIDADPIALAEAARRAGYVRAETEPSAEDIADVASRVLADWARAVTS